MPDWSSSPCTSVDFLRHGACEGGEIFRGSTDVALSELGWQQLEAAVEDLHWDCIVSSPLIRCRAFAEHLAKQLRIPLNVDQRWREFHFGDWEGRLRAELWAQRGEELLKFYSDPHSFTPPGGESYIDVYKRIGHAWQDLLCQHQGKRILVVTHAGIFRTIYARLQSLPSTAFNSIEIPFACLSRWKVYSDPAPAAEQAASIGKRKEPLPMLVFHNRQRLPVRVDQ